MVYVIFFYFSSILKQNNGQILLFISTAILLQEAGVSVESTTLSNSYLVVAFFYVCLFSMVSFLACGYSFWDDASPILFSF